MLVASFAYDAWSLRSRLVKPQEGDFGDVLQINLLSIRKELLYTWICEFLDFRGVEMFASVSVFRNAKDSQYESSRISKFSNSQASSFYSCESNSTGTSNLRKSTISKFIKFVN